LSARSLLAVLLLAAAVRAPFWAFAARASVDGDTAIVGLMARHPLRGTTMWGQPYGSPVDGWVAAPFVAALGPTPLAVRIPYALLALALVALAGVLGESAVAGAGIPAALLVACPSAYVLLMSALPPPLYATTLVLLAAVLLLAAGSAESFETPAPARRGRWILLGALAGLAVWTHLMSLATVAVVAVVLARRAWRAGDRGAIAWALVAFLAACAPWWVAAVREPSATAVLGVAHEGTPAADKAGSRCWHRKTRGRTARRPAQYRRPRLSLSASQRYRGIAARTDFGRHLSILLLKHAATFKIS